MIKQTAHWEREPGGAQSNRRNSDPSPGGGAPPSRAVGTSWRRLSPPQFGLVLPSDARACATPRARLPPAAPSCARAFSPAVPDVPRTLASPSVWRRDSVERRGPVDERMPRRKKKVKEASEAKNLEKKDTETTGSVNVKRKRREPKEENELQKTKTKQSNRAKCLAKRKIAQMTEEEQFALALRMSEQEAREVNSQEKEEEELLRKAIEESLNSCRPSDASATRSRPLATGPSSQSHQEKATDPATTEGIHELVPPSLFKGSHISQGNEAEEREEPWDHTENTEEEPVSGSSGSCDQSSQPVFENENVKCFDRCTGHLAEHTQCGKPQESTGRGCAFHKDSQGSGDTSKHHLPTAADAKGLQDTGGTVHYFWGIPFCPTGVDPNQYTKVILCQLEVYQKSLKMAQRQLLKKKGFGEPVLPRPPSLIQNECGQGDQASEKNEGISEDMGDEDKEERQESRASVWHSKTKDFQESTIKSLKEKLLLEEEPTSSHGQSSQELFVEETPEEENSVPASQSIAALKNKRSSVLMPESSAEEITLCPETQLSSPETFDLEKELSPGSRGTTDEVRVIMADKEGSILYYFSQFFLSTGSPLSDVTLTLSEKI
ncbi:hypothetical protein MC885_016098 [Smutsia gigantea]|nr:hypothetical protein MC885_016098 [Smutsia gigantea]